MQSAQNEPAAAEAHLVAALRDGDRQAFRKLVDQFQHPVYNLAFKILWNREDAEDVLQETFLKSSKVLLIFAAIAVWPHGSIKLPPTTR